MNYIIKSPETESEWERYFNFRWEKLRKPLGMPKDTMKDDKEEDSCHLKSESAKKLIKFWLDECNAISDWNSDSINNLLEQTQKKLGIKGKDLYFPLRTALYGSPKGPDIPLISLILGKSLTINRLGTQLS